jgi:phosphoribosylanthranilate isomerase
VARAAEAPPVVGTGVAVKFCGLTRPEDAAMAASLGAAYAGVIFAGGPRLLTPARACAVLASAGTARKVGVFGAQAPREVGAVAREVGLDVVQLHGDPHAEDVARVREHFAGEVWAVVRCEGARVPAQTAALFGGADAVVLDAKVPGQLGGTGVTVPWGELREVLAPWRGGAPVVLAGGLTPANVAEAVRALAPAVVDVSSGVEAAPGVKDHERMRAFRRAATGMDR